MWDSTTADPSTSLRLRGPEKNRSRSFTSPTPWSLVHGPQSATFRMTRGVRAVVRFAQDDTQPDGPAELQSDFEDYGHDHGATAGGLLDEEFQLYTDFFFDHAVVSFLFTAKGVYIF